MTESGDIACGETGEQSLDPVAALSALGALWSDDFGAYASGKISADQITCVLCMCSPCRCPAFGTPEYFALMDSRHGRTRNSPETR